MSNQREVTVWDDDLKVDVIFRRGPEEHCYEWRVSASDLTGPDVWYVSREVPNTMLDKLFALHDKLDAVTRERDEARGMVFELFRQACYDRLEWDSNSTDEHYDHYRIPAYEDAQAALISWGVIKAEQCRRTT